MLTLTQLQHLNPGDKLLAEVEYHSTNGTGEIVLAKVCIKAHEKESKIISYFHPSILSLPSEHGTLVPTPKHDPTRLFKKGDRIRFKTWHGFQPSDLENGAELLGKEATVYEDQEEDEFSVHFLFDGEDPEQEWHATYLPFIELVTPVEELAPYITEENIAAKSLEVRNSITKKTEAAYYYGDGHAYTFQTAAEASCAERDRLNAEWRKEQNP